MRYGAVRAGMLAGMVGTLLCGQTAAWRDPSPHRVQFVDAGGGVRIEVLDWGGEGRELVLVAGSGNTAHVFDDFAIRLREFCHVYAVTRRGYGASTHAESGYDAQRLGDDGVIAY